MLITETCVPTGIKKVLSNKKLQFTETLVLGTKKKYIGNIPKAI